MLSRFFLVPYCLAPAPCVSVYILVVLYMLHHTCTILSCTIYVPVLYCCLALLVYMYQYYTSIAPYMLSCTIRYGVACNCTLAPNPIGQAYKAPSQHKTSTHCTQGTPCIKHCVQLVSVHVLCLNLWYWHTTRIYITNQNVYALVQLAFFFFFKDSSFFFFFFFFSAVFIYCSMHACTWQQSHLREWVVVKILTASCKLCCVYFWVGYTQLACCVHVGAVWVAQPSVPPIYTVYFHTIFLHVVTATLILNIIFIGAACTCMEATSSNCNTYMYVTVTGLLSICLQASTADDFLHIRILDCIYSI